MATLRINIKVNRIDRNRKHGLVNRIDIEIGSEDIMIINKGNNIKLLC